HTSAPTSTRGSWRWPTACPSKTSRSGMASPATCCPTATAWRRPTWRWRAMAARWTRDLAITRVSRELRLHLDAPNPIGSYIFWNRTRREIALVPFGLWNAAGRVMTPYLDPAVFELLASLPAEMFLDKQFHPDVIRRAYPAHAYLRFDTETGLRPVRAPNGTPADAPYYRRLL